jgi:hypothetical protein
MGISQRHEVLEGSAAPPCYWLDTSVQNDSGLPQGPADPSPQQAPDASNRLRPAVPSWYDRRRHPWEGAPCSA